MVFSKLLFIAVIFSSCNLSNKSNNTIELILPLSRFNKLKGQYVYLRNNETRKIIDSTLVTKTKLVLNTKNIQQGVVTEVALLYWDTYQDFKNLRPIGYMNPFDSNYIHSSFCIDNVKTVIRAYDRTSNEPSYFNGSIQNEPIFKNVNLEYPNPKLKEGNQVIDRNIQKIKKYPYSISLLKILFYNKENFLDKDLKKQLSYFTNEAKSSSLFKSFDSYFKTSADFDKVYPTNIQFVNNDGDFKLINNPNATFHLIVFWASWCGPCRKEIPGLKKLYKKYKPNTLKITSISIDENKESWIKAMQQEQMPWEQFIAIDSTRKLLDTKYNIKAIPKAYLFNKEKKLVGKFEGFSPQLEKIIDKLQ